MSNSDFFFGPQSGKLNASLSYQPSQRNFFFRRPLFLALKPIFLYTITVVVVNSIRLLS